MTSELLDRVEETAGRGGFFLEGEKIIAAVSGGADSMCLLDVLLHLEEKRRLSVRVVHVHHGIREAADRDEDFVRTFCRDRGIPFFSFHVDVPSYAKEHSLGLEEAARILRYRALDQAAEDWEKEDASRGEGKSAPVRIALAHHLEDQAETILFHIARGTGIAGLSGMRPLNGRNIRPLLDVTRREIEDCLRGDGIGWVEDETNEDPTYARNRIRQKILPELMLVNEGAARHLAAISEEAARTEEYLLKETEKALKRDLDPDTLEDTVGPACGRTSLEQDTAPVCIDVQKLLEEPEVLRRRVIYACIAKKAGRKKDITEKHVKAVLSLLTQEGNGSIDLPWKIIAVKSGKKLYLLLEGETLPSGGLFIPRSASDYSVRIFPFTGRMEEIPQKKYTKWFDYDKISPNFVFRTRKSGDFITLSADDASGERKTKSMHRFMIDVRIPKAVRDEMLLPVSGQQVLWVPGFRISALYRITETTGTVLEITAVKGAEDGRDDNSPDSAGQG